MNRAALGALLSHWRRQPFQLATLILGLALATALWSGVQAINAEARASYAAAGAAAGGDVLPALVAAGGGEIDQEDYVALRRAGWLVTPVLEGDLDTPRGRVRLIGVEPFTASAEAFDLPAQPGVGAAAFILPPGRIFATPGTAGRLASQPGLPPVVATAGMAPGIALTDIGVAQRLLGLEGQISRLMILPAQPMRQRRYQRSRHRSNGADLMMAVLVG